VPKQRHSSLVCLNIEAISVLGAHAQRKLPSPLSSRCLNAKMTEALGAHALGGGVPKDTASLDWGVHTPKRPVLH